MLAENAEYSVMHGEVQPSVDNPIIRAVEVPAASLGNSTGDIFYHQRNFFVPPTQLHYSAMLL